MNLFRGLGKWRLQYRNNKHNIDNSLQENMKFILQEVSVMDIRKAILKNPRKIEFLLWLYNKFVGGNYIKGKWENEVIIRASKLKRTKIIVNGKNNKIFIDDFCRLSHCKIYIAGNNNVIHLSKKTAFVETEFHVEDDHNQITIGHHTSVAGKTHFAAIEGTKIIVGEDCMFSSDIHFRTGDSHAIVDSVGKRINHSEDIVLGNHVWIGTKVMCLKGVFVPSNCIVGAGTLLVKKYEGEYSIYAGTPAQQIKTNINWTRER